jgi:hypothetical protein
MNPNQVLPRFQSTQGCGACSGLGEDVPAPAPAALPVWPLFVMTGALGASMWLAYTLAKKFDPHRR